MPKEVIRRNGKRAKFSAEKIKRAIRAAAKDAKLPTARVKRAVSKVSRAVLKAVSKRKTVKTSDLKKKILSHLGKVEPAAARAWRKYDARRRARRSSRKRRR